MQVRWNPSDRSALRVRDPIQWYAAAREYEKILRAEESEFWVHLGPGTAVGMCSTFLYICILGLSADLASRG